MMMTMVVVIINRIALAKLTAAIATGRARSVVRLSVCLLVCRLATIVYFAKTAVSIEMPSGVAG